MSIIPWLLAGLGLAATRKAALRLTGDRVCMRLACWSYAVKIGLATLFYYSSVNGWPLFAEYSGGEGYWAFADDAQAHHNYGLGLARFWSGEGPFPKIGFGNWSFVVYVAAVYRVFGEHPLNIAFLNAAYGTVMMLAGWVIISRCGAPRRARRVGAALLAFWPSLLFWSSQPLKDPLLLAITLCVLAITTALCSDPRPAGRWWLGLAAALLLLLIGTTLVRKYIGIACGLVVAPAFGALLVRAIRSRRWPAAGQSLGVGLAVPLAVYLGSSIDLQQWIKPKPVPSKLAPAMAAPAPTPALVSPPPGLAPAQPSAPASPPASVPAPATVSREAGRRSPEGEARGTPAPARNTWAVSQAIKAWMPNLKVLSGFRRGFISTGGHSTLHPDMKFQRPADMVRYLPHGLAATFLRPWPKEWLDTQGRVGALRPLAAVEMILVYLLLVGLLAGVVRIWRYRSLPMAIVVLFVLIIALPMSLTVANLGTLFRLRLQFLLPLWLVASLAWAPSGPPRSAGARP